MATDDDALPVLIIDGAAFDDFAGFTREFSKLLCQHTWRGNLDAFNDILHGGFGTPENGWVLRWLNSDSSRATLGYEAMTKWLEDVLLTSHRSNRSHFEDRLLAARRSEGRTLFDMIVEIIRYHGPGGPDSEDGVQLELR